MTIDNKKIVVKTFFTWMLFFVAIVISTLMACSPTHEKAETNASAAISLDSLVLTFYKKGVNTFEWVQYFQLIKGNKGYVHILYDNDEFIEDEESKRIGKSYRFLYQLFRDDGAEPLLFDDAEGIISLNFIEEFPVIAGNKEYLIEKYQEKKYISECYSEGAYDAYRPPLIHYLCKDIGLIAIATPRESILVEHNSRVHDSIMKKISEVVAEKIEKTDTVFQWEPGYKPNSDW